jgi:alcohol dehydrogenase
MQLRGDWSYPTAVRFGAGRVVELPDAAKAAGITRPLLVTDSNFASSTIVRNALALLETGGVAAKLFAEVRPNPIAANIEAGVAAFRAGRHDGVVALGGGSALDVGKLIAFMAGQRRSLWDFEDVGDHWKRADPQAIAPVIALPTTAGTGSEVGRAAVVTHEATRTKKIIFHPRMLPKTAICDPELTRGLPPGLTAGTGMDALAHCLEAYCAPAYHPLADGIALEGMRLVHESLAAAIKNGDDIAARANMMAAALAGATAFQKGLGAIHALSHAIGALHDTHHGLTNAVLAPYVLVFNRHAVEEKIGRLSAYLGLAPTFSAFLDWLLTLRAEIGIPHELRGIGVDDSQLERIAGMAPHDPTAVGNPVPLDERAARQIFSTALAGTI